MGRVSSPHGRESNRNSFLLAESLYRASLPKAAGFDWVWWRGCQEGSASTAWPSM